MEVADSRATFTFTSAVDRLLLCYKFGDEDYQAYPCVPCYTHVCLYVVDDTPVTSR